jgi:hypothetical protein
MKYTAINFPKPSEGISFDPSQSLVIPDQNMSLETILKRFTRGERLGVGQDTFYDDIDENMDGVDYDKLKGLDLTELDEMRRNVAETIQNLERARNSPSEVSPHNPLDNNMRTDTNTENQQLTNP